MRLALSYAFLTVAGCALGYPSTDKGAIAGCPFSKAKRQSNTATATTFDPTAQKIDVSGAHAFQPPAAGDLRGPCPGLNALANHGYLPHNGVVTFDQAAQASNIVFGMGLDIASLLATLGVVLTGDPVTMEFSIGGAPGGSFLAPLLSPPQGLSGSHNKYEADASPGRGDYYLHNGDASTLDSSNFKALYDLQPEGQPSNYNFNILTQHRNYTMNFSIQNNPQFFHGPLTGPVLSKEPIRLYQP